MKIIKLSQRLQALVDLIDEGAFVADIGTDHGFLPVYLAQTGLASRIIASDISAASLAAAKRSAEDTGVAEAITFLVAPGLEGISEPDRDKVDTIVIAGMGGETILSILADAPWTKHNNIKLILQPQTKVDLLCKFLYDSGYKIKGTKYVHDRGKRYTIVCAKGATPGSAEPPPSEKGA